MRARTAIYGALSKTARLFNMRVYNPDYTWWHDAEFANAWKGFPPRFKNTLNHDRRYTLYNLCKLSAAVPGDLAECGVRFGHGSFLLLNANRNNDKHLHGFDSFEGLSEPSSEDTSKNGWEKNDLATSDQIARDALQGEFPGRFTLYKGWIPERFAEVADRKFSMVHIDVDLYEPTRDSAAFFWSRLNSGGILVCDDYGSFRCPGAKKAIDELAASAGVPVVGLPTSSCFLLKP